MKHTGIYTILTMIVFIAMVNSCEDDDTSYKPELQPPIIFPGVVITPSCTTASLKGCIDPRGNKTAYACEYGYTNDLDLLSPEGSIDGGFGPIEITIELTSLLPDTCCYFQWRASNIGGMTYGNVDSFMTLSLNSPPMTWLTAAPPETTVTDYAIHLYWSGFDDDGSIAYYEWQRIDEGISSPWFSTTKQDSIFLIDLSFTIDWRFLVRAVDMQDVVDPTPASYIFHR